MKLSKRLFFSLLLGVLFFGLVGCGARTPDGLTAEDYGEMGARIYLNPDQAQSIIENAGLNTVEFRERVRKISTDPDTVRRYRWAFERWLIAQGEMPGYEPEPGMPGASPSPGPGRRGPGGPGQPGGI